VSRLRWLPVALWLGLMATAAALIARAPIGADLSAFLPRAPTEAQQVLVDQLREGAISRLMLIAIEGAPQEQLAALSAGLAARLARASDFAYVNNGAADWLERDGEFLLQHRYLLSPAVAPERFTAQGLQERLEEAQALLASPMGMMAGQLLPRDPTGEMLALVEALQPENGPDKREGLWFSRDGRRALLLAQTAAQGFDIDAQQRAAAQVQADFTALAREQSLPDARLLLTGPGVFAVATRAAIRDDAERLALWASCGVALLLLLVYRSLRVVLLGLLPVVSGAAAGIAAVILAHGSVQGVTLGFGVTLIGEAVDYAIYLFTHTGPGRPPARALERVWPTLRLGAATSICGFSAMLFSGFPGLTQLGLFSIAGLLAALLVTRFVLPVLVPRDFFARAPDALGDVALGLARLAPRLRVPVMLLAVGAAAWLALRSGPAWDDRFSSLSPVPAADQALDGALRAELGAPDVRYLVVVQAPAEQAALERAEQSGAALQGLAGGGALAGFDSPARYLPSAATQRARQAALPPPEQLRTDLAQAVAQSAFRPGAFDAFLEDAQAARAGPLLDRSALGGTGMALQLDTLLARRDGQWYALLPLRGVHDAQAIEGAVSATGGVLLDLKRDVDKLYGGYRARAALFAAIGAAAIVLLLLLALRDPVRLWEALAPLVAALVLTAALLLLLGERLTLFHLVAMLLVAGVGSNYSLFFEHETLHRSEARSTLVSVLLCAVSTVLAFGLLATASAPVLRAIGLTVALGASSSLLFSAVFSRGFERGRMR
jgi:predicted exporter